MGRARHTGRMVTGAPEEPEPDRTDGHAADRLREFIAERFPEGIPAEKSPREEREDSEQESTEDREDRDQEPSDEEQEDGTQN